MRRIVAALVGVMLFTLPAAASDGRQVATAAAEAARALQQEATEAAAAGRRLDMRSPSAAENLGRIIDAKSFDELPPVAAADMPWLLDWLGAVRNIHFTLLYFGADPRTPTQLAPSEMERNVMDHEDEVARVMAFSQKFFPRVVGTVKAFFETLPEKERANKVRLDGFARMMRGYMESVEGSLMFVSSDGAKTANMRLLAAALRDNVAAWIAVASPEMRTRFAGLAATARTRTTDKEIDDSLRAIEAALGAAKS
jgi:hypothetical protein